MDVYVYRAALYCEDDATNIIIANASQNGDCSCHDCDKRHGSDSDDYPQGPYADGGGEADSPQNCDTCGVFLENPLTDDGREYVRNEVSDAHGDRSDDRAVLTEWIDFYGDSLA